MTKNIELDILLNNVFAYRQVRKESNRTGKQTQAKEYINEKKPWKS